MLAGVFIFLPLYMCMDWISLPLQQWNDLTLANWTNLPLLVPASYSIDENLAISIEDEAIIRSTARGLKCKRSGKIYYTLGKCVKKAYVAAITVADTPNQVVKYPEDYCKSINN